MRLEITPHVIDSKNLKMTIFVQKDDVDFTKKDILGDPYITKKQTQTVLIVKDGETIVISGLTKQTKSDSGNGWPWLKDIPVLGWLLNRIVKVMKRKKFLFLLRLIYYMSVKDPDKIAPTDNGEKQKIEIEPDQKNPEIHRKRRHGVGFHE